MPAADLSQIRREVAKRGLAARWGEKRGPSHLVHVDDAAFNALQTVPERDRREVASRAIVDAVAAR